MTARAFIFGHAVYWDEASNGFRYSDDHTPASGGKRKCPACEKYPTKEGYDPCIGHILGAHSVCCGHGLTPPVVLRKESRV